MSFLPIIISALSLGALSSFHCVGMCGAIAFSLPTNSQQASKKLSGIFLYNAGRIGIYVLLGLIFGLIGHQLSLGGFQQTFSIVAGILILLYVFKSFTGNRYPRFKWLDKINYKIQNFIAGNINSANPYSMLLLGIGNGLLPCGMVYLAITGALAAGSISGAVLFMTFFGLGTFPAMFLISWFGFVIGITARNTMKKIVPYVVAIMGILLILRGIGIGLPHAATLLSSHAGSTITCQP